MFRLAIAGLATLVLAGCEKLPVKPAESADEEIIATLNERVGDKACCFRTGEDANGENIYGPVDGKREIRFLVRRVVDGEAIACGWSGFPPVKAFGGQAIDSGPPTPFIVRGRRLYVEKDVPTEFERWQKTLCGDEWVEGMPIRAVP